MMIKVLPDIAAKVAEPLGQIDKITIIGGGEGGNGVDQVAGNVPVVMAKVFESMKEATGIDLADIINAESYDAQVNRNINVSGLDSVNLVVKMKRKPQNSRMRRTGQRQSDDGGSWRQPQSGNGTVCYGGSFYRDGGRIDSGDPAACRKP